MPRPKRVTAAQLDAILPYLQAFEKMGFKCGEWPDSNENVIPMFDYSDPVAQFVQALYDHGWVVPFDWTRWQRQAAELVESPEQLHAASAETLRKLLAAHVRQDHYCEGHLAAMFESGHIVAVLRRLRAIRAEMKS